MIYQEDIGGDNSGKLPSGGVLSLSIVASSMSDAIINPITFYRGAPHTVVNQDGQSSDLYNYYWTSYSRGTDGMNSNPNWHNDYLDSYIPSRHKSIYDPCPYGYRIPSNGTYNEFTNTGWTIYSYVGGFAHTIMSNSTWFAVAGTTKGTAFSASGYDYMLRTSSVSDKLTAYVDLFRFSSHMDKNRPLDRTTGFSIRCIEDCSVVSDATEASAGY